MENHGIKFNPINNGASTTDAASQELLNTIQRQLKSLNHKDIDTAYTYSSKEFQTKTSLADFTSFISRYPILLTMSRHLKAHSVEGSQGKVELELEGHGQRYNLNYKLVKEGDEWKIWNMKLHVPIVHCIETNSLCC